MPDIDIDFADRDIILDKLEHRVARLDKNKKHNTGVYVTEVPHNPVDMLSTCKDLKLSNVKIFPGRYVKAKACSFDKL